MGIFSNISQKFKVFIDNTIYRLPSVKPAECIHVYSSIIIAPTCTTVGYTQHSCSVCGNTYTSDYTPVIDHTIIIIPGYPATDAKPGLSDGRKCEVCGTIIQEQVEIPIAHSHNAAYKTENRIEATCTAAGSYDSVKYCTVCLEELSRTTTTIPATGHTEGSPTTENRTESTCTSKGGYDTVIYCTKCSTELQRTHTEIPLVDHEWGDWIIDKNPTETTTGSKHRECNNCTERDTETIPVLGHTHTAGSARRENEIAAGCETSGSYNLVIRCTSCGNILSSTPQVIPELGHDYDPCICSRCGDEDHDWDPCECSKCDEVLHGSELTYDTIHPTCTQDGQRGGTYCSDCKIQFTPPEVIPATGHNEITLPAVEPTCTSTGLTEGKQCSVCNLTIEAQQTVPAIDHTEVIIEATMPTCTEPGLTLGKYCSVCGTTLIQQWVVPATNHPTPIIDHAVEPTCTTSGLTQGTHCYDCGKVLTKQETIPATGHTSAGAVQENYNDATCVGNGGYDTVTYCIHCGEETSRVHTTILAPGHQSETIPAIAATCTSVGYTSGQICSVCGFIIKEPSEVPKLSHTNGGSVQENFVAATCVNEGSYDTVMYCIRCGEETSRVHTVIPPTGNHSYDNWNDCYCHGCQTEVHEWDGDQCSRCGAWAPWYDDGNA